jgi:uncharacterized membrane protein
MKFDMKFLLRITTYQCCELDVSSWHLIWNFYWDQFQRADSNETQMQLRSIHNTFFNTCFHKKRSFSLKQNQH